MATPSSQSFVDSLELVRRARAGESNALAALLGRYRERLLGRVRLMLGPEARSQADSEDFLQATLLAAIEHLQGFEPQNERAFLAWLTTIARNRIHDTVRRRRETAFQSLSESISGDKRPATPPSQAIHNEQSVRLVEALEALDAQSREIVELRDLEGRQFQEIGKRLELSEDRVRYLHNRAVLKLGKLLARPPDRD